MRFDDIEYIKKEFRGGKTIATLRKTKCAEIPEEPGVYLVVFVGKTKPEFIIESTGGHFKKKCPTVCLDCLEKKWVDGAVVLYIGKAKILRERITTYLAFGTGKPVAHWGGRYIWQIKGAEKLMIFWKELKTEKAARTAEHAMLVEFKERYEKLPFANLRT